MQSRYTHPLDIPLTIEMPLGLCYLAAVLRANGHQVKILDCLAEGYFHKTIEDNKITYGISDEEIIKRIREFHPQVIGVSALFTVQYENVKKLTQLIKTIDPKIITIVGGMHATIKPQEVLADKNIDFILQGESDYTLTELINALENNQDYSKIDGLGYKVNNNLHLNKKEKLIEDLDQLPLPARELLPIEQYYKAGLAHSFIIKNKKNINLITSRGCPASCVFCTVHLMWGRKFRARSPENVLAELEQIKNQFGAKHLQFEDDNLTFDIERAKKIFQLMIERKLNLKWTTPNGVAMWRMDKETLKLMKQSGCFYIKIAVESGNQRVLSQVIKKPQRLDLIKPLIEYARKIKLKVGSFFVVGLPGETKQEMQDSFDFPYKVKLDWAEYSMATPHYGTELRKICQENNYLINHTDTDLYARKPLINTPEFSARWLKNKVLAEYKRYVLYLFLHQPLTLISQGWEFLKRNPYFVINYLLKIFKT